MTPMMETRWKSEDRGEKKGPCILLELRHCCPATEFQ
jgi:hypothetical protein